MKKLLLIFIFPISFSSFSQTNYSTEKYYGEEFSVLDIKDYKSNKQNFIADLVVMLSCHFLNSILQRNMPIFRRRRHARTCGCVYFVLLW